MKIIVRVKGKYCGSCPYVHPECCYPLDGLCIIYDNFLVEDESGKMLRLQECLDADKNSELVICKDVEEEKKEGVEDANDKE